jgi:hypothetical protein
VSEAFEEAFVSKAAELFVHIFVPQGKRGKVRLEDHLVFRLRLEAYAEQQVVKDFLVGVGRVCTQGFSHEGEVEVRGDGRRVIDWSRRSAAKVPHDAPCALIEAGRAEGKRLGTLVEDGPLYVVVRWSLVVEDVEVLLPFADVELWPESGRIVHVCNRERADRGLGAGGADDERANVGRVRGATTVFDVADDDVDHFVDGRLVASGCSIEDGGTSSAAEADEGRQVIDEDEVLVHLRVPPFQKAGALWRKEVAKAFGIEAHWGRRLRLDRLQRDCPRGLDSH